MTTEEKAKAYDKALERARMLNNGKDVDVEAGTTTCEYIFPELKESEDERIRKELVEFINHYRHNNDLTSEQAEWCHKALTWLEKQKEQKLHLTVSGKEVYKICPRCKSRMIRDDSKVYNSMPPQYGYECPKCGEMEFDTVKYDSPEMEEQKSAEDWREKRKEECPFRRNLDNNLYGCERYAGLISGCNGICSWVVDYPKLKEIQDKQEQKPESKVEPKFRVGDTLRKKGKSYTFTVDRIIDDCYLTERNSFFYIQDQDQWELVSIPIEGEFPYTDSADTLDGEIDNIWSKLSCGNRLIAEKSGFYEIIHHFANWIEGRQPAEWSEEDEEALDMCLDAIPKKWKTKSGTLLTKWLKDNIYLKQEWSEEDERMLSRCIKSVECSKQFAESETYKAAKDVEMNWLKSLRPQPHWKPSEEQMKALEYASHGWKELEINVLPNKALQSLYNDLMKL